MDERASELTRALAALEGEMKTLASQVDDWILTTKGEEERRVRIRALNTILGLYGNRLPPAERKDAHDHMEALLHLSDFMLFSSVGYREKLQNHLKSQVELVSGRIADVMASFNRYLDRQQKPTAGTGTGPAADLIHVQEEERKRISREIHDGPAQAIATLTMKIDFVSELVDRPAALKAELTSLKEALGRSLQDIRRFIFDLRPMAIDDLGLIPTLEQFIKGLSGDPSMPVRLSVEGERRPLDPVKELGVFRVIQEAVHNARRHSRATGVEVHLKFEGPVADQADSGGETTAATVGSLSVAVRDNGVGFDVDNLRRIYPSLQKLGLLSMEERVKAMGGQFEIVSMPGGGTRVTLRVPG